MAMNDIDEFLGNLLKDEFAKQQSIYNRRMEICYNCKNLTKLKTCKTCKCFMPLKARLAGAKCPEHRWGEL